jgi:hypothetical protein
LHRGKRMNRHNRKAQDIRKKDDKIDS